MPVQIQYEPNDICVLRISGILKRSEFGAEERAYRPSYRVAAFGRYKSSCSC